MKSSSQKKIENIKTWIRLGFSLPNHAEIKVRESDGAAVADRKTIIEILLDHGDPRQFEIDVPLESVSRRHVYKLIEQEVETRGEKRSVMGKVIRFFAWWFGFSSLYATFAVCPFCGQLGCPVGMGSAGFVGGFFALLMQDWKNMIGYLRTRFSRVSKA
ncbi:MAG: hypothetical protein ACOY90_11195 [Candidatus Zhuqueibacterota bacterium]